MNILGIITEYNPFHYGHLYHLQKAKRLIEAEGVICIMNGNFVQRGEPALINKWARAEMALNNGVDLVVELPLIYGIRSAEYFAQGAIELLNGSGLVTHLVFGSEAGKIEPLEKIAQILIDNHHCLEHKIKELLSAGIVYPKAREVALKELLTKKSSKLDLSIEKTLTQPNNILGIEYLKALIKTNSKIKPLTIKRKGSEYHNMQLDHKIASATAIRNIIIKKGTETAKDYLPINTFKLLKQEIQKGRGPVSTDNLTRIILSLLRTKSVDELLTYAEINNGLENRIIHAARNSGSYQQLIENIKTKAFTWTRIQRNLLHVLLNIKENDFNFIDEKRPQYLRVLGFNNNGRKLLSRIKACNSLPLVSKIANHIREIDTTTTNHMLRSLSYDLLASDIYSLLYPDTGQRKANQDFTISPIIIGNC